MCLPLEADEEGNLVVFEVVRALGRRWYVVLAGLVLTCGLVYGAYGASPPEYHARGLVLLLPSESAVGKGGNPFLLLSGLEQPAGILVAYFSSTAAQGEVRAVSPTAEYQVAIEDSTRGPVIAVDVTTKNSDETLTTLRFLLGQIPRELTRLQQQVSAPANAAIGSMTLTVDQETQTNRAGTLRMMIAALVVGLVATGLAADAVDSLILRRRSAAQRVRTRIRRASLARSRRSLRSDEGAAWVPSERRPERMSERRSTEPSAVGRRI
jgi:hypothetical protein